MKAPGRPLVGVLGGSVMATSDVVTLADTCDSTGERKNITKKTDVCISRSVIGRDESYKHYVDAGK
jgi:hypothetical protein